MTSRTTEDESSRRGELQEAGSRFADQPVAPILIFALLALVVVLGFDRGWLPHDDGYLAMSAERVVEGETPHLDFDEIYSGGLTYLNAWALETFGMNLASLRVPYLVGLAVFVFSIYAISRRYFSRLDAALVASSVVFLGPYTSSSPLPSSYNVFLAGPVLLCLMKYYRTRSIPWVFAAGLATGLGVLAKTTGLYLALGVGIGLIGFHARRRASGPVLIEKGLLVAAGVVVTTFVSAQFTFSRVVGLVLPIWLVILLVMRAGSPAKPSLDAEASVLRSLIPFSAGILVPVLLFGSFMASVGALDETVTGLVSIPRLFVSSLVDDLPSLASLIIPLGTGVLLWRTRIDLRSASNWTLVVSIALAAVLWYFVDARSELSVLLLLFSWLPLSLSLVAHGIKNHHGQLTAMEPIALTTIACAVCMHLVRFPTSNVWYIFYSLPLAVVGFMFLGDRDRWRRRRLAVASLVVVASVVGVAQYEGRIFSSGTIGSPVPFVELEGSRGGIEVPVFYNYYNAIQRDPAVRGGQVLAGPDAPELYFMLDATPPGRSAFPLISEAYGDRESMLDLWTRAEPDTVIVNNTPANSGLDPGFQEVIQRNCARRQAYGPLDLFSECR